MSRIFWDSMLFAYLLDNHPQYAPRVQGILERSTSRGDSLFTSYLVLGELIAGAEQSPDPTKRPAVQRKLGEMGFHFLPFDAGAVLPFGRLRARTKTKVADAIHLACAASAGIDLFLTGDKKLLRLDVPGIHFIADFNSSIL
ncbi:MAG TPA: PIN domain-containing protein [Terracidiphilus sp.]|nr:PIN domain-containing protein [Terracidiphilus sp.]